MHGTGVQRLKALRRGLPVSEFVSEFVALGLLVATGGIAAAPRVEIDAPNVVVISADLVTAGQPTAAALGRLQAQGFGGVIYLAPESASDAVRDEPAILARSGVAYVNIPIRFSAPTRADFDAFAAAMRSLAGRRVLVHCQVDFRASSMVFLYRTIVAKERPESAYEAVAQVWSPDATWKRFLVAQLRRHGIAFEPY